MSAWEPRPAEPFEPGNAVAVTHGGRSLKVQSERAAAVWNELLDDGEPPWLSYVDAFQLEAWTWAEGQCRGLRAWLATRDPVQPNGKAWPASDELLKWERRAQTARDALGFNPLARARLGRDTAVAQAAAVNALDAIRATGAQTRAGRERTQEDSE